MAAERSQKMRGNEAEVTELTTLIGSGDTAIDHDPFITFSDDDTITRGCDGAEGNVSSETLSSTPDEGLMTLGEEPVTCGSTEEFNLLDSGVLNDDEEAGGVLMLVADPCVTDDEELLAMDSSSIIPEAAMKCGILPLDSAEEDSLVAMSSGEATMRSPDPATDKQQQQLCVGCKRPITERYLLKVMDQFWHEDCLKCSCCDCRLGEVGSTLFTKANLLLCRRDYLRLFGATGCCSVCSKMIPAFEMVMKAKGNVYHLECFACQQCNHRFCIGDRYYLYDNKILCEFDYEERIVFARLSQGYNALSSIKRQTQSVNGGLPTNCRASNLTGC